jgi:hypothetical protein
VHRAKRRCKHPVYSPRSGHKPSSAASRFSGKLTANGELAHEHGIPNVFDTILLQTICTSSRRARRLHGHEHPRNHARALRKREYHLFSARKLGFARGGGIAMTAKSITSAERISSPVRRFLTYGGMSERE